jgi:hypothetical protein
MASKLAFKFNLYRYTELCVRAMATASRKQGVTFVVRGYTSRIQ